MILVKCTKIHGNPTHSLATCEGRKALKGVTKYGGADPLLEICLTCDPEVEMKLVEVETGGFTPPVLQKKCKKVVKEPVKQELRKEKKMVKKIEYVCATCGEKTDGPGKFIKEKGLCRKCYMKEYYKKNPRPSGSILAPRMSRQEEDIVEVVLRDLAKAAVPRRTAQGRGFEKQPDFGKPKKVEVEVGERVLDIPVEKLTLRDIVEVGGEVKIGETKDVPKCKTCGIRCTEAALFSMDSMLCGECLVEEKREVLEPGEFVFKPSTSKGTREIEQATPRYKVLVDFTGHQKLYEFLEKLAAEDFRPVEMEILSILDHLKQTREKTQEGKWQA